MHRRHSEYSLDCWNLQHFEVLGRRHKTRKLRTEALMTFHRDLSRFFCTQISIPGLHTWPVTVGPKVDPVRRLSPASYKRVEQYWYAILLPSCSEAKHHNCGSYNNVAAGCKMCGRRPLVNELARASVRGPTTWHASVRVARKSRALSRTRNSLRSPTTPTSTTSRLGLQFGGDTHRNCRDAYVPVVQTFASVLT